MILQNRCSLGCSVTRGSMENRRIMKHFPTPPLVKTVCFTLWLGSLGAFSQASEPTSDQLLYFEQKVRPLLVKHCYECHSADAEKIKGGLLLDTKEGWLAGGDSGDVIELGKPDTSLLIETICYADPDLQMPPKYKLSDAEIAVLENWVTLGAPDPRTGTAVAKTSGLDWEKAKNHWAFQPVRKFAEPRVKDAGWVRDNLDRFILSKIESAGLKPAPDADRFALIRRVTLDLTGLPPTVDEVGDFVRDPKSDDEALAKVVDRLLASPAFGERWGRHWLDVARYADSVGKTRNVPFAYAWRYRNYVIDAFNADKPYNAFLAEQVAGDLMPAKTEREREENLVATGLLALGSMDLNENDAEQFQLDRIDDQMDTLGRATMGLTLGCARCHDHKFDPIAQTDYYAMAGIFGSTRTLSGLSNKGGGNRNYFNTSLLANLGSPAAKAAPVTDPSKEKAKVAAEQAQKLAQVKARLQTLQNEAKKKSTGAQKRKELQREIDAARKQLATLTRLASTSQAAAKSRKKPVPAAEEKVDPNARLAMAAGEGKIADLALRVRGEPDIKGDLVPRGFPQILSQHGAVSLPADASGRLELAHWLTSPEHPLTARVMVNRIWAHLLGRGLVDTVDNFGASGSAPTHPELLDYLSTRFVESGWSIKSMIRAIVLSRTYRLSGEDIAANGKSDQDNQLYWRANLRRLEAEAIRDSLLAAGGILQTARPQGAPFDSSVGADLSKTNSKRGGGVTDPIAQPIRSVYLPVFRSKLPGMFTVFDFAEPDQVNGQRDVTTVAPQALFLLNNPFVVDVSKRAADRVLEEELPDESSRVRYAYAYTLSRYPTESELNRALEFLGGEGDRETNWSAFVQALYSSAEFRYLP